MSPEFTALAAQLGPWLAVLLIYLPSVLNKLVPSLVAERRRRDEIERRGQELIIKLVEHNVEAYTETRLMLERITDQLASVASAQARLNEDVAGLYGHIGAERPSREDEAAVERAE
jgi:competence protein ComGC